MNYIIEILNCVAEVMLIFLFLNKVLERKYYSEAVYIISQVIGVIAFSLTAIFSTSPYINISVTFTLLLTSAILLYKAKPANYFFVSALYMLIIVMSETLFVVIFVSMGMRNEINSAGRISAMVAKNIIDFWFIVYTEKIYKRKVKDLPLHYWLQILLMPFLSAVILDQLFDTTNSVIAYSITICGLLYLNLSVFNYFESYDKQVQLAVLEQAIEQESKNYKTLVNSYSEIRNIKHDLKNQVSILNDLICKNRFDEARDYMQKLYKTADDVTSVYFTGNSAVDSVINLKAAYAKSLGIEFGAKINVSDMTFDTVNLCRILANAMDNATEACEKIKNDKKFIFLALTQKEKMLILEIKNSSPQIDVNNLSTSKKDKKMHGIGLQSIRHAVSKMNGHLSMDYKDGCFSLKIVLTK